MSRSRRKRREAERRKDKRNRIIKSILIIYAAIATAFALKPSLKPQHKLELNIISSSSLEKKVDDELKGDCYKECVSLVYGYCSKKGQNSYYNPNLYLSILDCESEFYRWAVSRCGAASVSQTMPDTAKSLKLKVYAPNYYYVAWEWYRQARRYKSLAGLNFERNNFEKAKEYKLLYNEWNKKANTLFNMYKKDLLKKVKGKSEEEINEIDQRFILKKAIMAGMDHFADCLKKCNGDVRVALGMYNAGFGAVLKYEGIPPYDETMVYVNKVVKKYCQRKGIKVDFIRDKIDKK